MNGLEALAAVARDLLWLHALVFLRVAPMIALFPGFGESSVPMRIKLGLALGMAAIVTPAVAPDLLPALPREAGLVRPILVETGIGAVLGIGLRLFVLALQTAGAIAAQATSLSQILGTSGATPMPAMGQLLLTAALALAMALGLHLRLAEMAVTSYLWLPQGQIPAAEELAQWGIAHVAQAMGFALTLAAPFVIASMLYNLTLGIINRAMPQLMVVFVGAPAITAAGLFLLMLFAPAMLGLWAGALGDFLADPLGGR